MPQEKLLTKLVRPMAKGQITLPIEFRRRLNIDEQTFLSLTLRGDRVEIVPVRPTSQRDTLRQYSQGEIERFLREDRLDRTTAAKVRRLLGRKRPA